MSTLETPEERKKRFKSMSSDERRALIREKMKIKGLLEGSGVQGKNLTFYNQDEVLELIQVTRCFAEMQTKQNAKQSKPSKRKKSFAPWILLAIALTSGMIWHYKQYPSIEIRRELSVDGIFLD